MTASPAAEAQQSPGPPRIVTAESLSARDRRITMAGVLIALLLAGLDQTIVATAGPAIQRDLRIAPALYAWLTTAYLVAATVMLPIYGKLSDRFGRKPILLVGVSVFLLGSLLCGIAPGTTLLIVARGVQGLGAAALFTTTFAVIADLYPPAVRGRYMGLVSAVMGLASVIGPLAGGFITDQFGWHWVFFVNLPIGGVAIWFIVATMPRLGVHSERVLPVDIAGAILLIIGLVPLMIALSLGRADPEPADGYPWGSWPILTMFGVAAVSLVAFVIRERRAPDPIVHLELFRNRIVSFGTGAMFVLGSAFLFSIIFLPLFLVNVVGVTATDAGLAMMPLTLGLVIASISAGQLVSRVGHPKLLMLGGLTVLAGAYALLGFTLTPDSGQGRVSLLMLLVGLGTGPTLPLYTLVMQASSEPREIGVVTATATFSRLLGQVIGLAIFGTVFATALAGAFEARLRPELASLPPAVRDIVRDARSAGTRAREEQVSVAFDTAVVRAHVRRIAPGNDAALAAVGRLHREFQLAFTDAVSLLFRVGIALVVLAFVITAFMPEVELSHAHARPAVVE